jgi:hypothetical protein
MSEPQFKSGPPPTRRAYDAHEVVSALQKAIRRSDPDATIYWSFELAKSGFGNWLWKRLRIIAVEDVSPEAIGLVADVKALNDQWRDSTKDRGPEGELLYVARAAISLAIAPKSRVVDWAAWLANSDHHGRREIPDESQDMHTRAGRRMGRGLEHFLEEASRLEPWTGTVTDLEADYRELAARRVAKDPALPSNPWSVAERHELAQNSDIAHSGHLSGAAQLPIQAQLAMTDDQEDR